MPQQLRKIDGAQMKWHISTLKEWDKNPRNISPEDFERLKTQIRKLGQYKPLLIIEDGTVIGGNMRLKAYKELKVEWVWVSLVSPKNEDEMFEYALSDNDRAGYYDSEALANIIDNYDIELDAYHVDINPPETIAQLVDSITGAGEGEVPKEEEKDSTQGVITCENCGCKLDKQGNVFESSTPPQE